MRSRRTSWTLLPTVGALARQPDDRDPPRLAHRPERRTDPHRHPEAVAGVARDAGRLAHRTPEERPDQVVVVLEAAGRQDDGAGPDDPVALGAGHLHAGDRAVLDDEPDRPGTGARAPRRGRGTREGGRATNARPRPSTWSARRSASTSGGEDPGATADRRLRDAHRPRRTDHPLAPAVQPVHRDELGLERPAAAWHPARVLRVVVGEPGNQPQRQRRMRPQPLDDLVAAVDERLRHLRPDHPVRQRVQVGQARLAGVLARPRPRATDVAGIHTTPLESAVVPPTRSAFSTSATDAPESAAASAATSPAAPVPRTTTSNDVDGGRRGHPHTEGAQYATAGASAPVSRRGPGVNVAGIRW